METKTSPRSGGFVNDDVCGRQMNDGTVGSVCGKPAEYRIQFSGNEWRDAEATACREHVDELAEHTGVTCIYRHVSDEVWSNLYGWLGDRTSSPDGDEWEHEKLHGLVRDLLRAPLTPVWNELDDLRDELARAHALVRKMNREALDRYYAEEAS